MFAQLLVYVLMVVTIKATKTFSVYWTIVHLTEMIDRHDHISWRDLMIAF